MTAALCSAVAATGVVATPVELALALDVDVETELEGGPIDAIDAIDREPDSVKS
tara:strand:- start:54 stop:215 length:162 start_codon:yes stop_codon:yes gene_type:complete